MLNSILFKASNGIATASRLMDTTTRNITNASTEGYTKKVQNGVSVDSQGNAWSGPIKRAIDTTIAANLRQSQASLSFDTTKLAALQKLDALSNDPAADSNLGAKIDQLGSAFQTLQANPSNPSLLSGVVDAASDVASAFRTVSGTLSELKQTSLKAITDDAGAVNTLTKQMAGLNQRIATTRASHSDSTDLEDERDRVISKLSELLEVHGFEDGRGVYQLYTADNKILVDEAARPLELGRTATGELDGTLRLGNDPLFRPGGRIGANQWLRDELVPQRQAQLDELASRLTVQFDTATSTAPGADRHLELFKDDSGTVHFDPDPAKLPQQEVGYASRIGVNTDIVKNPLYLRTGTWRDRADVPPPANREEITTPSDTKWSLPASDTTVIATAREVFMTKLTFSDPALTGSGPLTLSQAASNFTTTIAADVAATQKAQDQAQSTTTLLADKLAEKSGVSLDEEMARLLQLQNSYAATAKVMTTAQTMYDQLLDLVR
ncbi:flagellar hook-associated protein FlgK [Azospirillum sp. A1-3]|uniref:flagellar hook-associated protein FlgK n=1 Tax=Azospirillum sp. A1-3 TaxID=185874 RepID=UPI002077186A|nr:flagellar hook-associated protein FlgK [Azospirillum sp. A1-3]MCM8738741.1 flagellar hook-associated protein FlgK [Azospirillum sp. A1-3]